MTTIAAKNRTVGIRAALFGLAMLGLAFASVPLYRVFCAVTGFGGTTMRADAAPGAVAGEIGVRFDANIDPALPWKFEPEQGTVRIHPGARTVVAYRATNLTTGSATAVWGRIWCKFWIRCRPRIRSELGTQQASLDGKRVTLVYHGTYVVHGQGSTTRNCRCRQMPSGYTHSSLLQ